jgi:hypothetical protein
MIDLKTAAMRSSFFLLGGVPAFLLVAAVLAILTPRGERAKG